MKHKYKLALLIVALAVLSAAAVLFLKDAEVAVLEPRGEIADKQRDLIILTTLLMLIVVIPVFILTFFVAWRYREGNKTARYSPDWDHNRAIEIAWWAIPGLIITVLAVVAWRSSHELDPFRPLNSSTKPITIQVVALQWKWLFIYPEQGFASVNFVQFPEDTPLNFEITADAPMNSFWIPQLGGQVYAMAGMRTKLHLIAEQPGDFSGSSANISGRGFSGMRFTARATSRADFDAWTERIKKANTRLDMPGYNKLAQPSIDAPVTFYSSVENDLHQKVMMKFMAPGHQTPVAGIEGMHHN